MSSSSRNNNMKSSNNSNNSRKILSNTQKQTSIKAEGHKQTKEKHYNASAHKVLEVQEESQGRNNYLIPLIIITAVLPFIMKLKTYKQNLMQFTWYQDVEYQFDLFLYYKQWIFAGLTALMIIILLYWKYGSKKPLEFKAILVPLALYGFLSILSALFSDYKYFSFRGSMDQFENLFVLIGYCIVVYYAFIFVKTENDVRTIMKFILISVFVMSALGLSQFLGHDFFSTKMGASLITSRQIAEGQGLTYTFEKGRVYLTMFNPNYVGIYAAMLAPIFLVLLLFSKKLINSIFYLAAIIGLIICLIGSNSLAGLIALGVAAAGVAIFMWRYIIKRYYITIPIFLILFIALLIINQKTDGVMINRIKDAINVEKKEKNLTEIITGDDMISFTYKGNLLNVDMVSDETGYYIVTWDGTGNPVKNSYDPAVGYFVIEDERFPGFVINIGMLDEYLGFYVQIDGRKWYFTDQTGDGTYYYLSRYDKWDKIVNPPTAVFDGIESFASGRGYIWARSIPMIKDYILLGSGPDTYTMAFPQRDYVGFYNYGYEQQILTKPHSLYLQTAIQTGLVSLIAFLVFYAWYLISCIRLYIRGRLSSYYAQVGVSICIGTIGYMVAGITNDSSVTTAPVFWCLIGIGLAVNSKAKPLIMKERAEIKTAKLEKKA